MGQVTTKTLLGERINMKLITEQEKEIYRRAKAIASELGLSTKEYTLYLYRIDDLRFGREKKQHGRARLPAIG